MDSMLARLTSALRVLRWSRREKKTALSAAACFAAIPLLRQLPLEGPYQDALTWTIVGLGSVFICLTSWRLTRYSLAPPAPQVVHGGTAIKGAGSFTPEDADLFARLGRLEELRQLRGWILDDTVPVIALMGESGVGKTSLLRAGLTFILDRGDSAIPFAYWEANPQEARDSFLNAVDSQLGTRDLEALPPSVLVADQLEQLDPARNAKFFELLRAHLEREPPYNVTWVVAFRREFGSTWLDFQLELSERSRRRPQMLSLRRFSTQQAKEVFATLAEEAEISIRQSVVEDVLDQLVESGSVSPVDLGITLQVFQRQPELAEDAAAFRSVGGPAGLLTLYLEMTLEPYAPGLREDVLRSLLALVDKEEDRRLPDGRSLDELRALARPQVPHHLEVALEALAQPGVRVLEKVEDTPRRYRLIHERFIPALRRLTGELLGAADRASRLLERRFLLWEREERQARYLLHGGELLEILKQRGTMRWGKNREDKLRFIERSRRRRRNRRVVTAAALIIVAIISALAVRFSTIRTVRKEMFEWGLPEGSYQLLPRVTDLAVPPVSNTRWLSRATSLRALSLSLAPQYEAERGQEWPPSLQSLSLDLGDFRGASLPEFPENLQQLSLVLRDSQSARVPRLPSDLDRLSLVLINSQEASLPKLPVDLQQLSLVLRNSQVATWPELPAELREFSLDFSNSQLTSLPELPANLQQLSLDLGSDFSRVPVRREASLPELPATLQELSLGLGHYRVTTWPDLPANLQELALELDLDVYQAPSLPELPAKLQWLSLDRGYVQATTWHELPASVQQLSLDLSYSSATTLPELPASIQQLSLTFDYLGDRRLPIEFPPSLQQLSLVLFNYSEATSLPAFPPNLQKLSLSVSDSQVRSWPELPANLQHLTLGFFDSEVTSLPEFPPNLQQLALDLRDTEVTGLPEFPPNLQQLALDLGDSKVTSLPEFPPSLQQLSLDLGNSKVTRLPGLPPKLQQLSVHFGSSQLTSLSEVPSELQCLSLNFSPGSSLDLLVPLPKLERLMLNVGSTNESFSCSDSSAPSEK